MKAYVSLHTAEPDSQIDSEVYYPGYERTEVEYDEGFITRATNVFFPQVPEGFEGETAVYMAVGTAKKGQGGLLVKVPLLPYIPIKDQPLRRTLKFWTDLGGSEAEAHQAIQDHGLTRPHVCIAGHEIKLPDNLNPIARRAFELVYSGLLKTSDIHPGLFEVINDALQEAGVPILTVTRSGTTHMKGDLRNLNISEMALA